MYPIKIHINKLGAIKDSDITITPIMVFSGESGLGKSYAAILSHYIFDILLSQTRLNRYFEERNLIYQKERPKYKNSGDAFNLKKIDIEDWLSQDAVNYMKYMLNNEDLIADIHIYLPDTVSEIISVSYEEEYLGLVDNEEVYVKLSMLGLTYRAKEGAFAEESPYSILLRFGLIRAITGSHRTYTSTFVFPPSRGPVMTEEIIPITGLYRKFKNGLNELDVVPPHPNDVSQDLIHLVRSILDGTVERRNGKYMYQTHDTEMPVSAAAASVRELGALSMLVERYNISETVMLIEEPEAHLHPLKQRMMADITSAMNNAGGTMQITTHSDYFLRRLNELIMLKKIQEQKGEEIFLRLCEETNTNPALAFDYNKLSAYLLIRNDDGTSRIERQDITEGIPFSSFSESIDKSLDMSIRIDKIFDDECNSFV